MNTTEDGVRALRDALKCTGTSYLVNPDYPDEGTDLRHEGPCPLHDRRDAAQELLDAFEDTESGRWVDAKLKFLAVVGYRVGDRVYFAGDSGWLHSGEVVERIDDQRVRLRFDDSRTSAVVNVAELCPITAELLVAAGEVLDLEPIEATP